ncbi:Na+/H+ antiporter NhaC family protein [Marinobacterium jannaschii]|uniref:Na+/H+ antiporter NhaC family protein n=1 Tax=Marinobacterium jannaschii TaxID=64970 RepID=UPI0009FC97F8|nr:Na+/H+ antiporter NhaC family protein [Marinobacterium jannaschii]
MLNERTESLVLDDVRPQFKAVILLLSLAVAALAIFSYQSIGTADGSYGALSLFPTLVVIATALYTKRTIESLFIGVLVGLLMTRSFADFIPALGSTFLTVFQNDTVAWIFIACGLMGSMITLVTAGGGAEAFGGWISRKVQGKKPTLFATMGLGILIFIDDYLNAMTIGSSMRKATDKVKTSREFLAYVVDSTAAPVCIILPFSTWAVFFSGLLEENKVAAEGEGINLFIQSIPYMFYAWICLAVVVLAINNSIPLLGKMREAEERTERTGAVLSEEDAALENGTEAATAESNMLNFFVPIGTLIFFTWYFDIDIMSGAMAAIFVTLAFYFVQRLLPMLEMFDAVLKGFVGMIAPLGTLFCGFMLAEVNNDLGTTEFVIQSASTIMTAELLPATVFITMAGLAFATASFWGIFVVGMPIIMPLAMAVNADMPLVIGAMISASAFGSHACFYGDSTVLSAKACGISPMNHALTQLPYTLISAAIATLLFFLFA